MMPVIIHFQKVIGTAGQFHHLLKTRLAAAVAHCVAGAVSNFNLDLFTYSCEIQFNES